MKENGSLCQVEQLPHRCLLEQGLSGCHPKSYKLSGRISVGAGVRTRANGAVKALCNNPDCSTSVRLESTEQIRRAEKVLVTGGSGFFGFRLGKALARQGISVILLDLHPPQWELPDGAVFLQGDVRDYNTLYKVCAGVDCIFHTASYGMSGPEQLRKEQVESVNVGGTNNIINVCCERGVSRLVYTSTVNVVFAGEPIEDGDEDSVTYVPLDKHIDHYSRTKAISERMILTANRRPLPGVLLRTRQVSQYRLSLKPEKFGVIQVRNIAVSHTFRIEKARQELGFSPKKYTLAESLDQYLQSQPVTSTSSARGCLFLLLVLMMMLLGLVVVLLWSC
ncbi:Short-chain dehydrogenase/reductase family 42E member 1 [Bagarius yarrelli]|uniref:Short-chain dehydrogenase/reductase family 42E member 1 n=1 Tax=Bagarius yarrelli TaxID=175774 RepID=A0A556V589_BAGYA|nr:Short-chain dehydrogenase/reductase family 42E member 1 [Bagarius yarrelli]